MTVDQSPDTDMLVRRRAEVATKLGRVRTLLERLGLARVLLTAPGNVSWITAGAQNSIIRGSEGGAFCWALVTLDEAMVISQNVEGPRLIAEERLEELGFSVIQHAWYAPDLMRETAIGTAPSGSMGADAAGFGADLSAELVRLRLALMPEEAERLSGVCKDGAEALEEALRVTRPGELERDVAARIVAACEHRGIVLPVLLVGSGERMRRFRHCPPSDTRVERDAMAVIVGVRYGLNTACTRMISFGKPDPELDRRQEVTARVEAAMIAATVPGRTFGEALQSGIDAYGELGFPGEHEHHYQGGPIGYGVREFGPAPRSRPDTWTEEPIPEGCACAWNPTVRGGKSEDTFLVRKAGPEILTVSTWPQRTVEISGLEISRPGILAL